VECCEIATKTGEPMGSPDVMLAVMFAIAVVFPAVNLHNTRLNPLLPLCKRTTYQKRSLKPASKDTTEDM